jgi:hypothetical protein
MEVRSHSWPLERQVGVKKGVRRSKQDELIVAVDEAIGFGRGGLED